MPLELRDLSFGWSSTKWLLLAANLLLGLACVTLSHFGLLPLSDTYLFFFSFVGLLIAIYRPGWAFLFLVGMLPYETVTLSPDAWGFALRPYQLIAGLLLLALITRFAMRTLPFKLPRFTWSDGLLAFVVLGSFLAVTAAPSPQAAFKQTLILVSFGFIYVLVRLFLRSVYDLRQVLPFFFSSALVVFGYALWQNLRFLSGHSSFQVMEGRPNATFSEADWLGMFTLFVLALVWTFIAERLRIFSERKREPLFWIPLVFLWLIETAAFMTLLLSVSRSAWLGTLIAGLFALALLVWEDWNEKAVFFLRSSAFFGATSLSALVALILILSFHLTPFPLVERAASTAGFQTITVSCAPGHSAPARIGSLDELSSYGCRHIRLEEISQEKEAGNIVMETSRPDPNVSVRAGIYERVRSLVRDHILFGIGWGSAAHFLGHDERGAGLNASNVFLEVWLSSGLIGFVSFVLLWGGGVLAGLLGFVYGKGEKRDRSFLLVIAGTGLTIFDLFNSGILLGFFFLFLGLIAAFTPELPSLVSAFVKRARV